MAQRFQTQSCGRQSGLGRAGVARNVGAQADVGRVHEFKIIAPTAGPDLGESPPCLHSARSPTDSE